MNIYIDAFNTHNIILIKKEFNCQEIIKIQTTR